MINSKTQRIFEFIQRYQSSNKETPTMVEIGKQFGMSSVSGVHKHVVALQKAGLITIRRKAWRGITIVQREQSGIAA